MTHQVSEECAAVAFYGVESTADAVAKFYRSVVEWFGSIGYIPDKLAVDGPGHSGKFVSFARANTKLLKHGFHDVVSIEFICLMDNANIWGSDYVLSAHYSEKYSVIDVVSRSSIAPLSHAAMLPLARRIVEAVKPGYGIGYTRDHRLGPELYAVGICKGLGPSGNGVGLSQAERDEAENISFWTNGMGAHVWRQGLLRDVYPWNFLTQSHLDRSVDGIPLRRWIEQNVQRGTLSSLSDGVLLWEVPEDDLTLVRERLHASNAIFNWKKNL
jgi:hypothetical protein